MAWKEVSMENLKQKFILLHQTGRFSMTELCRQFEISRPTGYSILSRFETEGWDALDERSRSSKTHPNQIATTVEAAIIKARNQHPRWGARKILVQLQRTLSDTPLPSESTVNNVMKRHGLVVPRKKARRKIENMYPVFDPSEPNIIWSADFKGKFRLLNDEYCNPLTIADSRSRYLLAIQGLSTCRAEDCIPVFERCFREYGMPEQLHTDNGPPFGSPISLRRLTALAAWFIDHGVTPVYSDPGHPEQNGRHERMHRELKADATRPASRNWRLQQRRFDLFRKEYNEVRPHEALDMKTPAEVHRRSEKEYSRRILEWAYPTEMRQKMVTVNGALRWSKDGFIMISTALANKYVGLEPIEDGVWIVWYRHVALGVLSERTMRVYELGEYRL